MLLYGISFLSYYFINKFVTKITQENSSSLNVKSLACPIIQQTVYITCYRNAEEKKTRGHAVVILSETDKKRERKGKK